MTVTPDGNQVTPTPPSLVATPTPAGEPTETFPREEELVCSGPPSRFNYRENLGIERITSLRFENEDLITFEGWANHPEPEIRPVTPEPTPAHPLEAVSSLILLSAGQLSLADGEFTQRTLDFAPLRGNPCGKECPSQIIGESPDGHWQLVQVGDWLRAKVGVWLVSEDVLVQLVDYVPAVSQWEWASDSSLLWYVYNDREYGIYGNVVQLDTPPVTIQVGEGEDDPLDPLNYFLAFSPPNKTVLSTENPFEQGLPDSDAVYTFDLTQDMTQATEMEVMPGIVSVVWDQGSQDFLLETVQEDGVHIRSLEGTKSVTIPRSTMETIFPALAEGKMELDGITLNKNYVLSPSGQHLAIAYDQGEIWVFSCE